MHYILQMTIAFLVLFGIVLLLKSIFHINSGEGFFLSVSSIVFVFYLSSLTGTFIYGFYVLLSLSILGVILCGVNVLKSRTMNIVELLSPVCVVVILLYLFWLVFLWNDFIQHIDELHHWAAGVKYMLEKDAMPTGSDFLAGPGNYAWATTLFHLFFQKFTGYNEQSMYVSAALLTWIGFLLPLSNYKWKDWKKILLYVAIFYIGLYSLYSYGTKSLYVDVPVAAWAGGLASWWTKRNKKKTDYLIIGSGLIMLHYFKASAGLLMALFVLIFVLAYSCAVEKRYLYKKGGVKAFSIVTGALCALVILGSVAIVGTVCILKPYEHVTEETQIEEQQAEVIQSWSVAGVKLPDAVSNQINIAKISREKVKKTIGSFVTSVFGTAMASKSNWDLPFLPCVIGILILFKVYGDIYEEKKKSQLYLLYSVFCVVAYSMAVFISYILLFAYELSIEMRSCGRYYSVCSIFLLVLLLNELLQNDSAKKETACQYVTLGILFFFALGLNANFIPNASALKKEKIAGYEKIKDTKTQLKKIQSIINEEDKVYYLCQQPTDDLGGAELYNCTALYYMEGQISNYLCMPWKFTTTGSNIRLEDYDISINEFPNWLTDGGYTYLWVHTTNTYLTNELPKILNCDQEIKDGHLYKVIYVNGRANSLELIQDLDG